MSDEPPRSNTVEHAWNEFHGSILSAMDETALDPGAVSFSRASYYFGALGMLEIVETILSEAKSDGSRAATIGGLRAEIEEYIAQRGAETRAH